MGACLPVTRASPINLITGATKRPINQDPMLSRGLPWVWDGCSIIILLISVDLIQSSSVGGYAQLLRRQCIII